MEKLDKLTGVAVPLLENNIDTDVIFPARFLLILERQGLGKYAFHERKHQDADFELNRPEYQNAPFLVTGSSFGTGSSREQAVWALADLGIRCVIAPSFGEIFFANCFKNGVLPILCNHPEMENVEAVAKSAGNLSLDLTAQTLSLPEDISISFDISPYHKNALQSGLDEAGMILKHDMATIEAYEKRRDLSMPWLSLAEKPSQPH
jgi:3-isopropylmalate/(R)-2-methylmalate dehydratase small subunit